MHDFTIRHTSTTTTTTTTTTQQQQRWRQQHHHQQITTPTVLWMALAFLHVDMRCMFARLICRCTWAITITAWDRCLNRRKMASGRPDKWTKSQGRYSPQHSPYSTSSIGLFMPTRLDRANKKNRIDRTPTYRYTWTSLNLFVKLS